MTARPTQIFFAILTAFIVSGCETAEVNISPATTAKPAIAQSVLNTHCPIHKSTKINKQVQGVKFKGHAIGFCTTTCEIKWKRLTLQRKNVWVAQQLRD